MKYSNSRRVTNKTKLWSVLNFLAELGEATLYAFFFVALIEPFVPIDVTPPKPFVEREKHPFINGYEITITPAVKALACGSDRTSCRDVILLTGDVNDSMLEGLRSVFEKTGINDVCISSPGGSTKSAYKIGKFISDNSINTCMADTYSFQYRDFSGSFNLQEVDLTENACFSSCPFILVSGQIRRYIGNKQPSIELHKEGYYDKVFFGLRKHKRDFIGDTYFESDIYRLIQETSRNAYDYRRKLALYKKARKTKFTAKELYKLTAEDIDKYRLFTLQ